MSYNSKYTGAKVEALLDAANGKQDKIKDLDEIRSGAAAGATALQSVPSEYVTETELANKGYATTSALNDKVDKVSGKQLSTEDFTSALKTKLEGLNNYDDTELSEALSTLRGDFDKLVSGDTTTAIKTFNEVIAFLDGVQDTQDLSSIIASIEQQIAAKMDKVTLATVATSGSYNDLSNKPTIPAEQVNADWNATSGKAQILNKPTIPSAVTESTVSGWGFTKNTGTYSKPSGGIPKTDLASAVQTSLGKADTALQSYTEKYTGTITGIKMNGASKGTSGVVDLGTVITDISGKVDKVAGMGLSTYDFNDGWADKITESEEAIARKYSKPSDGIPRTDLSQDVQNLLSKAGTSIQATEFAGIQNIARVEGFESIQGNTLYALPDTATGDEDDIIATTNTLKTINGQSIVGSGDITISGGGGGTITGVSANGTSIATSGVANIPAASTSAYGVTKLSSATNSTSTTLAATASAVKSAYDLANSYKGTVTGVKINGTTKSPTSGTVDLGTVITSHQDISGKQDKLVSGTNIKTINNTSLLGSGNISVQPTLVSGTNIKTINGTSILGSGNITISGGGGSSSGSGAYAEVNHGTSDTTFTLTPNTFHVWDEVGALTLTLGSETGGVANEFLFQFTSGATATSLTLPDDIKWVNDNPPTIAENKIYQVSILKGLASVLEFANAPSLIDNKVTVSISGTKYLVSLQYAAASDIVVKVRTADGPISVNILSGEISKTARPAGPMVDSGAFIESITPSVDTAYNYVW